MNSIGENGQLALDGQGARKQGRRGLTSFFLHKSFVVFTRCWCLLPASQSSMATLATNQPVSLSKQSRGACQAWPVPNTTPSSTCTPITQYKELNQGSWGYSAVRKLRDKIPGCGVHMEILSWPHRDGVLGIISGRFRSL